MARSLLISLLVLLVAMVTGCGGAHRYDGRLVAVDSLMKANPDSALALVEALSPDSLHSDGDCAYCDLLLTQARYKCYVKASSDSNINRALNYYSHHTSDREKLTRAYIYKGAVMEELAHPDSAMYYYKTAEASAAPNDYANLGYIKMRMGELYNSYYTMNGKEIMKYEEALKCYQHTTDTNSLFKCLNNLGCFYRETDPQKAEELLKRASYLARQLNDTNYVISNTNAIIFLYLYTQQYEKARVLVQQLMQFKPTIKDYQFWFTVSNVYAKLHIPDSAQFFFDLANKYQPTDNTLYFQMYYLDCLSAIELANGDTLLSLRHQQDR